MSILPKDIYRFSAISTQHSNGILHRNLKKNFKFLWNHNRPWIANSILRKKNKAGGIIHLDFKLYYSDIVIKMTEYWHKNRCIVQWNRSENPEINPHICGQLIFDKGATNTQWEKNSIFNKCCWKNWITTCRRMRVDLYLIPLTKLTQNGLKI